MFSKKHRCCYISNELSSTVCICKITKQNNLCVVQYVKTVHPRKAVNNYVAEVAITHDEWFLYVSNRGANTLACFRINQDGGLHLFDQMPTRGKTPRHFSLTPDERYVIVANQDSHNLSIFQRHDTTGKLTWIRTYDHVPSPNYVLIVLTRNSDFHKPINLLYHNLADIYVSICTLHNKGITWACQNLEIYLSINLHYS